MMQTYDVTAARATTPTGEEFLVISIPAEQYNNEKIRGRWFAAFRKVPMPFVIAAVTSEKEWSLRSERSDLTQYLGSLPFGSVGEPKRVRF
ncbi:MAG: hypothetical protein HZA93_07140 [Verrucomicrobia bacterium]|nr:hypothetical protein [Verrucomicrobiota bacterium]